MQTEMIWWVGFAVFMATMLALDLGVFHRKAHVVSLREALIWTGVWIATALLFNVLIYFFRGHEQALKFLTGYVIEKSLSVDNVFVFYLIFTYFAVPRMYQHRVLFWGILGALAMRAVLIAVGITLINTFHWIVLVFGVFLIITGIKMAFAHGKEIHPESNPVMRLFCRVVPTTKDYEGQRFFVRHGGKLMATPLFAVLVMVETTDLVFAVDSIPAILAITTDPFIVYTSNAFAILGLRALFFTLAGVIGYFRYLHYGLSVVLVFVGTKMMIADYFHVPIGVSLGVITGILTVSVGASIVAARMAPVCAPETELVTAEEDPDPVGDTAE